MKRQLTAKLAQGLSLYPLSLRTLSPRELAFRPRASGLKKSAAFALVERLANVTLKMISPGQF